MKFRKLLCLGAAVSAFTASQADAANIILVDQGGVTGSAAQHGFQIAAAYWSSVLSNNITIRLGVSYAALPTGVIGSTRSFAQNVNLSTWEAAINATKSNSAVDTGIVLPTLTNGAAAFIANGPAVAATNGGIDTSVFQYDNDTTGVNATDNKVLFLNTANVKAIGGTAVYSGTNAAAKLDGAVQFSSNFGFDFNPTDGIDPNTFDFIGVAIHEIGHALGFVSGTDTIDYFGRPNGPGAENPTILGYNFDSTSIYSALDMFRYSNDPHNVAPGNGPVLDESVGTNAYFSIDGGATQFNGASLFSTGTYNGDGNQTSHWKDLGGCAPGEGIMDPNFCYQQPGVITATDLAAFDAIGYNIATDSRASNYLKTTSQIYNQFAAVPEPATWAMMIMGFGLMGASMRRNRKVTARIRFA